ncbi:MAG: hypothetical protein Q8M31_00875 [Beijerinckiaceae bacterium]|nr:hypothetical protein [Beijerinckiaceae bacterium]
MSIAKHVIAKCGGPQAVADMLGITRNAVDRWKYAVESGGAGGIIPSKRQRELMEKARERGIELTPADFFFAAEAEATA